MTTTAHTPAPETGPPRSAPSQDSIRGTARTTGLLYLALAITGILGFLLVRPLLFVPDDPTATMANLLDRELMARAGIVLELGIVVSQALVALWFYRLFRTIDPFAAGSIAVFGLINAITILGSAAFLATALEVARSPLVASAGDAAGQVHLMYVISENLWGVGAVFFGLWLIPMGWCALQSGWMPRALGWVLIAGGVGYVLSAVVSYIAPDLDPLVIALTLPATVGEFWMIGYLLLRGVRRSTAPTSS
ncbi:MAG TPA: DUF4386 domain-containing protein [Pleomorphomonadaceae bacterium]|nr:DUF4386 domain-containing protein [Pleomorphomonadaceae bacterium]